MRLHAILPILLSGRYNDVTLAKRRNGAEGQTDSDLRPAIQERLLDMQVS